MTFLSEHKYIFYLLTERGLSNCKPIAIPTDSNHKMNRDEDIEFVDKRSYKILAARLIYLSHTRPGIFYCVGMLRQFIHSPNKHHLQAAHRLLRYLKWTIGFGLFFKKNGNFMFEIFTDQILQVM